MKKGAFYKKECGVSSEVLEGVPECLYKSERGDETFIKYMRMSSIPSPQVINDPPLNRCNDTSVVS